MLIDTHCHLDFPEFAEELDQVVARAAVAGVGPMITISTKLSTLDRVRAVAERFAPVFFTVGVHPHEAASAPDLTVAQLVALADHPKCVGIGETGLDFYYEHSPRDAQERSFRLHIEAARRRELPVVIHTRDAAADTMRILGDELRRAPLCAVMHCFSSGQDLADFALAAGFYLSASGVVTFKKAEAVRAVFQAAPLDRILVETDAPFLAPFPHRGRRNEPAFAALTARVVADARGESIEAFAAATTANALRLFSRLPRAAA